MSDLDLRDIKTAIAGGKRGPAIVPGKASESLLYKAIRRDGDLQMPPGKSPLTAAEVKLIDEWINAGAPWESSPASARVQATWWSFRKVSPPPGPADEEYGSGPKSHRQVHPGEAGGEGCAARRPADPQTLVRRAYFDLHGLPPTPAQVDEFVNDKSPDAWEKLVDRLLASPRYGERWGRYWLDLVRYADTSGFETDHFFTTAWRYRDYVINSFNSDKPYNTFVQEQIAADETLVHQHGPRRHVKLPKEKEENVNRRIGTSLFTLGSFPIEFTYYGDQFRAEWQADAVDTVGAAFLGLTVGCARCHDHKFDPIRQRDYYSLTAHVRRKRGARDSAGQPVRCSDQHAQYAAARAGAGSEANGVADGGRAVGDAGAKRRRRCGS